MKRFESLVAGLAALALFAMMLLTFVDVIGRKLIGQSIPGAVELTELGMLVMIFMALPLASLAGEHITFDLLDRVLPVRLQFLQQSLANALTGFVFGGAAWLVWRRSGRTFEMGDITSRLEIPLGPFHRMIALMLLVTAVAHVVVAWRNLVRARQSAPVGVQAS